MPRDSSYYFNTLPLHPQPKMLESFISYLTRLCEANCISSMWQLGSLAFPSQSIQKVRNLKDHSLPPLEHLQLLVSCSKQQLLQTTFYHLGNKFDRTTPESLIQFLQRSVAKCLRYCPHCLTEEGYYSLTWRFTDIIGCSKHKCRLFDVCCHCKSAIPLFTLPLMINICSNCGKDLRQCQPFSLTDEEIQKTFILTREIEFLLMPQEFEGAISPIKKLLGLEFVFFRQRSGVRRNIVNVSTKINQRSLATIEFGTDDSTSFQAYLNYAQYLGVTLSSIFTSLVQRKTDSEYLSICIDKKNFEEEEVLAVVQKAIDRLIFKEETITIKKISQLTFISSNNLKKHSQALILIEQARRFSQYKRQQVYEQELLKMSQQAINYLNEQREPITYNTVGRIMGINPDKISRFSSVKALVKEHYISDYQRQEQVQEINLIINVNRAKNQLEEKGEKVTFLAVSKIIGINVWILRTRASVRSIILSSSETQENDWILLKVKDAISRLEVAGIKVTTVTVSQAISIHRDKIRVNPQARKLLTQKTRETRLSKMNHQTQDEAFILDVNNAVQELLAKGKKITQDKICKLVGVSRHTMTNRSTANAIIKKYVNEQKQQREEALLLRVQTAIQSLMKNGQPLTYQNIGKLADVIPTSLFYYPKVAAFVKSVVCEQRQLLRLQQHLCKEDEIIQEILKEVMRLQQSGTRISINVLMKNLKMKYVTLKYYPKAKEIVDKFKNRRKYE